MKMVSVIKDSARWVFLSITFLTYVTVEIFAIYWFYKAIGVI